MLIFIILMALAIPFLVAVYFLTTYVNRAIYMHLIQKKFKSLNFTINSVESISPTSIQNDSDEFGTFVLNSGGSPITSIYKKVKYKNDLLEEKECFVTIKKMLFLIISINYDFIT